MTDIRATWIAHVWKLAQPVCAAAAAGELHQRLPLRCRPGSEADRLQYTHLEALGRTLAGLAPWLEGDGGDEAECALRHTARELAVRAVAISVDPAHPDRVNFTAGQQPIVDAAFLAHALVRAPQRLAQALSARDRRHLVMALSSTRDRTPAACNWLLFAAMIEAGLAVLGERPDTMRVDYALCQHEQWYKGDGAYGDGPHYHHDYYNAFVIVPMLVDILATVPEPVGARGVWTAMRSRVLARFTRAAAVQERQIAADGTFPPLGRSLTYRCGAFQTLAQAALQHRLPVEVAPAAARGALDAVIARTLGVPSAWDASGWLMPGLHGHQPDLAETYISTGSLYLASVAFLPLGLPPEDAFWSAASQPWTQVRMWRGDNLAADHALSDS